MIKIITDKNNKIISYRSGKISIPISNENADYRKIMKRIEGGEKVIYLKENG